MALAPAGQGFHTITGQFLGCGTRVAYRVGRSRKVLTGVLDHVGKSHWKKNKRIQHHDRLRSISPL